MKGYFASVLDSISRSVTSLDQNSYMRLIDECVETLSGGHKVIVSGLGKNVPVCDKFVGTMLSLGLNANFLHTNSAAHGDLGMVNKGDVVIILSKSGSTSESVYLAEHLLMRGSSNWLMTFGRAGKILNILDKAVIMALDHEGDPWNIMPNNSTIVYMIVLQGLAMQIAERLCLTLDDFRVNHPGGAIGEALSHE